MPDLTHTLQGTDLGFLRMVAGAWGFELDAPDAKSALPLLVDALRDRHLVPEVVESLPAEARLALQSLVESEGRSLWAAFTRRFGEVRPLGPARRDRERPDLNPISTSELLWYRALVSKAFLHFPPAEPQEYAYIPDDLLELLPEFSPSTSPPPGRAASPGESAFLLPASDRILDDATTLLAACRSGIDPLDAGAEAWAAPLEPLRLILRCAGLLDPSGAPVPEAARAFLEAPRGEALADLAQSWMESPDFNELRLLPGLACEGEWLNHPLPARQALLEQLSQVPPNTWWSLAAFVGAIKERIPDFQRPAGDYDSWFVRRISDGSFLRGFGCWDEVDGALVRYLICGPLHLLGLVDLAAPTEDASPAAFRFTPWAFDLWHGAPPAGLSEENGQLQLNSAGKLRLLPGFPRSARYQVSRFCLWLGEKNGEYHYRLSPASLERARQQGLRTAHLVTLLRKHAAQPLPPTLLQALERWEKFGAQAGLEEVRLLRLASPELLAALRKTRASRYLGEALTPTVVVLKPGAEDALQSALAELGYLVEF